MLGLMMFCAVWFVIAIPSAFLLGWIMAGRCPVRYEGESVLHEAHSELKEVSS